MNTLFEAPAHEAETVGVRHDDVGVGRKACRVSLNQGRSMLRLEATVRMINFRRDDIERTHWKKVSHSMIED